MNNQTTFTMYFAENTPALSLAGFIGACIVCQFDVVSANSVSFHNDDDALGSEQQTELALLKLKAQAFDEGWLQIDDYEWVVLRHDVDGIEIIASSID